MTIYNMGTARLGKMLYSTPPVTWHVPIALNQTITAGDFVYRNAGYLTLCGDNPALILGIAKEDGTYGAAGNVDVAVLVATEITMFNMCVYHATPASAVFAQADEGVTYEIIEDSGNWMIDIAATAGGGTPRVRVQQFIDKVDDRYGRVLATVLSAGREVQ